MKNTSTNVVIHFLSHKKIKKINPKLQEDTHEESLEDCLSWWWRTRMYKIGKIISGCEDFNDNWLVKMMVISLIVVFGSSLVEKLVIVNYTLSRNNYWLKNEVLDLRKM